MTVFVKDPDARVDYSMDWGASYLGDQLIETSSWSVTPQGDTAPVVEASSHDGRKTAVSISGGLVGKIYDLTNRIILSNSEKIERSISIHVEQR